MDETTTYIFEGGEREVTIREAFNAQEKTATYTFEGGSEEIVIAAPSM